MSPWLQETNPFTYVEINGLKVPDPTAAYSLLWEGVSGRNVSSEGHMKISAKESLKNLSRHFSAGGSARGRGGPGGHAWYGLQRVFVFWNLYLALYSQCGVDGRAGSIGDH